MVEELAMFLRVLADQMVILTQAVKPGVFYGILNAKLISTMQHAVCVHQTVQVK